MGTILLVEDHPDIRRGHHVIQATDGSAPRQRVDG
jgi:hypothetical protein